MGGWGYGIGFSSFGFQDSGFGSRVTHYSTATPRGIEIRRLVGFQSIGRSAPMPPVPTTVSNDCLGCDLIAASISTKHDFGDLRSNFQ